MALALDELPQEGVSLLSHCAQGNRLTGARLAGLLVDISARRPGPPILGRSAAGKCRDHCRGRDGARSFVPRAHVVTAALALYFLRSNFCEVEPKLASLALTS
jgi:hypothetical protein